MTRFTSFLLLTSSFSLVGCVTQKDGTPVDTEEETADTQTDSGDDTDDLLSDTACDEPPEGDAGETFEAVEPPRLKVRAGSIQMNATDGKYISPAECATWITAEEPNPNNSGTTLELILVLEGSLDSAGSYNALSLDIYDKAPSDGNVFEFGADSLSGITLDVTGFGPNGAAHGALSGEVTLSDSLSGESVVLTALELEGWEN